MVCWAGISGLVVDGETGEPLANANIVVLDTKYGTATREDGSFELEIPSGSYKVEVRVIGYEATMLEVTEESTFVRVALHPSPIPLEKIEIVGERPKDLRKEERDVVHGREIRDLPTVKPDIFRTLQALPGVTTTTDLAGWLFVRGGEPDENLYLLDHGEVTAPYHLLGIESVFNPEMIGRVEFSPGGFGAEHGNRLSAVLDARSKDPAEGEASSRLGCDMTELWAQFEAPLTANSSFAVSSRRGYVDLLLERMDLGSNIVLPYYSDLHAKVNLEFGQDRFSLTELRSMERLKLFAVVEQESIGVRWGTSANVLAANYNRRLFGDTGLGASWFLSNRTLNTATDNLWDWHRDEDEVVVGLNAFLSTRIADLHSVQAGTELRRQEYKLSANMPENLFEPQVRTTERKADTGTALNAVYVTQRSELGNGLEVKSGVRLDDFRITGEVLCSPRLALGYRIDELTKLGASWGHYYQVPALEFLEDGLLKAERATHFVLGAERSLSSEISLRVDLYDKELDRLVTYSQETGFENHGFGFSRGVEFMLRKRVGRGSYGWLSYTYSKSQRRVMDDSTLVPFDADQPHILNMLASVPLPWRFRFGIKYRYASGTPYTPVLGKTFDGDSWWPAYGERNSQRLPPYQRLDLRVKRGFGLFGRPASLHLQLINVLQHKNIQGYIYDPRSNMRVPYYMLPFIPAFGFEMAL